MFLADTDVLIDFLRGEGAADRIAIELGTGRLCTTVINAFELWVGAKGPRQHAAVESLLAALTVIPLDMSSTRRAAEVRIELERRGQAIGMADSLVAGIAMQCGAILISRNRRHYERVQGLRIG